MAWIFYLSHQSAPLGNVASGGYAIGGHVGLYAALALLLFWALAGAAPPERSGPLWLVAGLTFALTVLYGAADEVHQAFVAGRTASEADLGLDAVGALVAALVATGGLALLRAGRGRAGRVRPNP